MYFANPGGTAEADAFVPEENIFRGRRLFFMPSDHKEQKKGWF